MDILKDISVALFYWLFISVCFFAAAYSIPFVLILSGIISFSWAVLTGAIITALIFPCLLIWSIDLSKPSKFWP